MGNRLLKETICSSENIDALTPFQETFFYRLIVNCDDYGRMDARPAILASKLYPLRREIPETEIEQTLRALAAAELITTYRVHGKPYLQMKTWSDHQRVRNSIPKYPAPEEGEITSCGEPPQVAATCGEIPPSRARAESNPIQSESNPNIESNPNARPRARARRAAKPPTREEVRKYCRERNSSVDPDAFYDYFTADPENQWVDSKGNPVKSWKQKIITWEGARNGGKKQGRNATENPFLQIYDEEHAI